MNFSSLNLSDGAIQGYIGQPLLTLFGIVTSTYRELIEKPNGVNDTHLSE